MRKIFQAVFLEFNTLEKLMPKAVRTAFNFISILAAINFLVFVVVALSLGGDSLSGKTSQGHYFLGYRSEFTEVSKATFIYSKYHVLSVLWSFGLLLGGPLILACLKVMFKSYGRSN